MKDLLKSKYFIWGVAVFSLLITASMAQKLYKRYTIEREIAGLQEEIEKLEQNNQQTLELINYFKTSEFKERQARSLLGLQKPGEFAVALPPRDDAVVNDDQDLTTKESENSNLSLWWEYFFTTRNEP